MTAEIDFDKYTPSTAVVDGIQRPVLVTERAWWKAFQADSSDALADRYVSKLQVTDVEEPSEGCWLWTAAKTTHGYGQLRVGPQMVRIHAFVWAIENGGPPPAYVLTERGWEAACVGHLCHDQDLSCPGGPGCSHRRCANPAHLTLQSHSGNLRSSRGGDRNLAKEAA
ncbi:hypothetical protein [Streptomyces sp. CO7]